ncbi:MAG: pentapeptide repeat-containing protein [Planctomycetota bacterium]|nr:pentapeptide repeat-containing protein [Planctomycetota bacterium]
MIDDGQLEQLKRRFESDPDDLQALLRYIDGLRRLDRPFLEMALLGVAKGIPIGPEGIHRDWFKVYWKPFTFWKGDRLSTELAGPFVDLSHRSMNRATLTDFDLCHSRFHLSEMKGLILSQSQLRHGDFTDCDLSAGGALSISAQFSDVDASDCNLGRSHLRGATFQDTLFRRASFHEAKMVGAFFYSSNFDAADFHLAQIDASRAYDCNFQKAKFHETSMDGLIFDTETQWPADFDPFSNGALAEI